MLWSEKPFLELTGGEVFSLMRLRSEVLVVEQNCVYLDLDDKDAQSIHYSPAKRERLLDLLLAPLFDSYPLAFPMKSRASDEWPLTWHRGARGWAKS